MSLVLSSLPTLTASLVALVRVLGWKLPPPICKRGQTHVPSSGVRGLDPDNCDHILALTEIQSYN